MTIDSLENRAFLKLSLNGSEYISEGIALPKNDKVRLKDRILGKLQPLVYVLGNGQDMIFMLRK